jgi:hypothetical protein
MTRVASHHTQSLADARDGAPPVVELGLVRLGRLDDRPFNVVEPRSVVGNQGEVAGDPLLHSGRREPRRQATPLRLVGQLLSERGPVVLTVRLLDVREALGVCARQRQAVPRRSVGGMP